MSYEVISDGHTVWVNNEAVCLGRFSRFGIDIHSDLIGDSVGVHCLDCKPADRSGMTEQDWTRFKEGMLKFHNVVVGDEHMPIFLRQGGRFCIEAGTL